MCAPVCSSRPSRKPKNRRGCHTHLDGGAVKFAPAGVIERVTSVALVLESHEAKALGAAGLLVKDELQQGGEGGVGMRAVRLG